MLLGILIKIFYPFIGKTYVFPRFDFSLRFLVCKILIL